MSENHEEIEIDDDALALAAGGVPKNQADPGYEYSETIYFQSSAGDKVT